MDYFAKSIFKYFSCDFHTFLPFAPFALLREIGEQAHK